MILRGLGTESINFLVVLAQKILTFIGPGIKEIEFLVVQKRKILILSSLGTFQRALGRLQEVLEGFWAENIDFSLVFQGFGGEGRMGAVGWGSGLGAPKPRFFKGKAPRPKR